MIHARLQPVWPPPFASRRSSVARAAARQLGRAARRDLVPGMQREQMRDVAMAGLRLVVVLEPFLDLAVPADLQRRQPRRAPLAFAELRVAAEDRRGARIAVAEQLAEDLRVHRRAHAEHALRRSAVCTCSPAIPRAGHQPALRRSSTR